MNKQQELERECVKFLLGELEPEELVYNLKEVIGDYKLLDDINDI